jgi:hypothetical protein
MAGRTGQFSVGTEARLGGGSARAERLADDTRRLEDLGGLQMPYRHRGRHECRRTGDGGIDPEGEDLPHVPRIIGVAIEVLGRQLESRIQGGTANAHPEDDEEEDRQGARREPTHMRILACGLGLAI